MASAYLRASASAARNASFAALTASASIFFLSAKSCAASAAFSANALEPTSAFAPSFIAGTKSVLIVLATLLAAADDSSLESRHLPILPMISSILCSLSLAEFLKLSDTPCIFSPIMGSPEKTPSKSAIPFWMAATTKLKTTFSPRNTSIKNSTALGRYSPVNSAALIIESV